MMRSLLGIIIGIIAIVTLGNSWAIADGGFGISPRVSGIDVPKTNEQNVNDSALIIVTEVVNWILSLLSVIAIIIFIIGGYKVITAGGDDSKVKSGYKFIKNAIIGILIIGLTRAIIRLIFWFVNGMVGQHDFNSD